MPFRNVETHFSRVPTARIKRSAFRYNKPHKFTMNTGDLVPFLVEEVLPGDTFDLKLSKVVRLTTSIHPTMDNLYLDTYFFFVPNRFIWDNWTKFMGENDKAWTDSTQYIPPYENTATNQPQSIFNYLGVPVYASGTKQNFKFSLLPFNAYCKVWNDWFRSESLCDEVPIFNQDGPLTWAYSTAYTNFLSNSFGVTSQMNNSNSCLKVAKFADYFTRALPQAQKGADVLIPAGGSVELDLDNFDGGNQPIFVEGDTGTAMYGTLYNSAYTTSGNPSSAGISNSSSDQQQYGLVYDPRGTLSLKGLEITINNLRLAAKTQALLERDARSGTRYTEIILGHFGVQSPDMRIGRSEYLGGKRTLINMSEVIQTSESTSNSPLGQLAGRSITTGIEDSFIKSFTEHGFIIGVCCVRPDRTYSQGIRRMFSRFNRLDYYFPILANIGDQPVLNKEIYLPDSGESVGPDEVFGYQEAWSEYKTQFGQLSGYMQPGITGSLASWTYADNYNQTPSLSSQWLYTSPSEVDRTLAVASTTAPQFICDFLIYGKAVRPMPVFAIPSLSDTY